MYSKTKKTVLAALIASLVCVATMIIKIPSPLNGYINLGDCVVLLAGWTLSPTYGFMAAAIGSAMADIFLGYAAYAPATFVIKGLMALTAYFCNKKLNKQKNKTFGLIIGGILAEVLMVLGYFLFEGIIYDFPGSALNIPANAVQGIAGIIIGLILVKIFDKANISLDK